MPIEAYGSSTSAFPGEELTLHASSGEVGEVGVEVRRLPTDEVVYTATAVCGSHPVPQDAHATGCGWPPVATVPIAEAWPSGVYCAWISNEAGETTCVHFVVKARVATTPSLLSVAVTTYEAYNCWPTPLADWPGENQSLYEHEDPRRSRRVSFDRPNLQMPVLFPRWEGAFVEWASREGLSVDCCTSIDLHRDPGLLSRYQLLLSVGHDEYWTKEMRDNVEAFVSNGGNVAFFGGNTCQWQIRLEHEERAIACYKNPLEDPLTGIDNERVTVEWYVAPVERPTNTLTGVSWRIGAGYGWGGATAVRQEDAAYTVCFPDHWAFADVDLADDGTIGRGENVVGYETDAAEFEEVDGVPRATGRDGTPSTFVILATADLRSWHGAGQGGYATMGTFRRNGTVFTAGTVDWTKGLGRPDSAVPQITRNVIRKLSRRIPTDEWELIGHSPPLTSMATFERKLFAVGEGRLWHRDPTGQNVAWRDVDAAADIAVLASTEADTLHNTARLVGVRGDALFWRHCDDKEPGSWHEFGQPPSVPVTDLTYTYRAYFAVGGGHLHWRGPFLDDRPWKVLDVAEDVISLDSWWNMLIALTRDGRVMWRPPETAERVAWSDLGSAPRGASLIGAVDGRLVVSTVDGLLWWRSLG